MRSGQRREPGFEWGTWVMSSATASWIVSGKTLKIEEKEETRQKHPPPIVTVVKSYRLFMTVINYIYIECNMYIYIYIIYFQWDSHINVLNMMSASTLFFTLFDGSYLSLHVWLSPPLPAWKVLCLPSALTSFCSASLWPSSWWPSFIPHPSPILSSLANLLPSPSKRPLYSPSFSQMLPL